MRSGSRAFCRSSHARAQGEVRLRQRALPKRMPCLGQPLFWCSSACRLSCSSPSGTLARSSRRASCTSRRTPVPGVAERPATAAGSAPTRWSPAVPGADGPWAWSRRCTRSAARRRQWSGWRGGTAGAVCKASATTRDRCPAPRPTGLAGSISCHAVCQQALKARHRTDGGLSDAVLRGRSALAVHPVTRSRRRSCRAGRWCRRTCVYDLCRHLHSLPSGPASGDGGQSGVAGWTFINMALA